MKLLSKKRIIFGLIVIAVIVMIRFTGVGNYFTLENLQANREYLQDLVQRNYILAVLAYILAYMLVVTVTLPVAFVMMITGGFLFGTWFGAIYANIAATVGATASFLWIRHFLGKGVQKKFEKRLVKFNKNMDQYGSLYLLVIHFMALVPFFVINSLAAMTNVSLLTFIWTTSAGIIPISLLFAYMGSKLGTFTSVGEVLTPQIFMAFAALALIAMLPIAIPMIKARLAKKKD